MSSNQTYLYQINITRDCNLRCTHCYIHSDTKKNSKTMTSDNFKKLMFDIKEHMEENTHEIAEIHVIGGEPTMLGLKYFQENIPYAREILNSNDFKYKLCLVSNLLNDDILEIAKLFDHVATSYEPETRFVSAKGKPKPSLERQWVRNVHTLKENGIDVSATVAMTKPVIDYGAENILNKMYYEHKIKQIHFGFFIPEGDGLDNTFESGYDLDNYIFKAGEGKENKKDSMGLKKKKVSLFPDFIETSNFLIRAAEWYFKERKRDNDIHINPVESMLSGLEENKLLDDIVCPIITGSMDINWDGNVHTCLEAGGSKDPNFLSNAFEVPIKDIVHVKKFKKEVFRATKPHMYCSSCEYYKICRGGCSVLARWWDVNDEDCPGFKKFIRFLEEKKNSGVSSRVSEV